MWIITGVLLGLFCLAAVAGFHLGPHTHAVAGASGSWSAVGWSTSSSSASGPGLWSVLGGISWSPKAWGPWRGKG